MRHSSSRGGSLRILVTLALAILSSGCATWFLPDEQVQYESPRTSTSIAAATPNVVAPAGPATAPARASSATSARRDDASLRPSQIQQFACVDGMRLQASFSGERALLRFGDGRRLSLPRVQSDGFMQYASAGFEFRRSGPRAAFVDGPASVRVRPGDTLGDIAVRVFGRAEAADEILYMNAGEISDPNLIRAGQVIRLPRRERACRRVLV